MAAESKKSFLWTLQKVFLYDSNLNIQAQELKNKQGIIIQPQSKQKQREEIALMSCSTMYDLQKPCGASVIRMYQK